MRRIGGVWGEIVSFENLMRAARHAARGKRRVASVARFLDRVELEVLQLQRELLEGSYHPGEPFEFKIVDPKPRTISAAPFRDRVVHHALIDVLEPWFDRRMVHESFACRRGKGNRAALQHARKLVRRYGWFLKMDVRRCFPSIDHDVVDETLRRIIKDRTVLALFDTIAGHGGCDGVGLPIGSLTSQWLCNLVLDRLDHFVKEELRAPGYVRYMDDFALLSDDAGQLREWRTNVEAFLGDVLRLEAKHEATILAPTSVSMPFLGWQVFPGMVRLRPQNLRRTRARLRHRRWQHRTGQIDERMLADAERSVFEHLRQGHTLGLRRRLSLQTGDRERATTSSGNRVNRGGSYQNPARNARAANRNHNAPAIRNNNLGVRPAKRS